MGGVGFTVYVDEQRVVKGLLGNEQAVVLLVTPGRPSW
jgi:hypothetical protein